MTHEHKPITKDNEIICIKCGTVLANTIEYPYIQPTILQNLETHVKGHNISYMSFGTTHEKYYTEQCIKVYNRLLQIIDRKHLPKSYANEAMRIILARKRGLWSYKWQLMTLIQLLINTNDVRLRNHIRHLKKEYEYAKGT